MKTILVLGILLPYSSAALAQDLKPRVFVERNGRIARYQAAEIATVLYKAGTAELVNNREQANYSVSIAPLPGIGWSWKKEILTVTSANGVIVFQESTRRLRQAARRAEAAIVAHSQKDRDAELFK
jgi:hypothetical protein